MTTPKSYRLAVNKGLVLIAQAKHNLDNSHFLVKLALEELERSYGSAVFLPDDLTTEKAKMGGDFTKLFASLRKYRNKLNELEREYSKD